MKNYGTKLKLWLGVLCLMAAGGRGALAQEAAPVQPTDRAPSVADKLQQQRQLHPLQRMLAQQMRLVQSLELTDEQRTRLRDLVMRRANEWQALNIQTRRARAAYNRVLMGQETAAPEILQQRSRELGRIETEWARIVGEVWLEVRQILTPEQFARFRAVREEQMQRRNLRNNMPESEETPANPDNDRPQFEPRRPRNFPKRKLRQNNPN